MLAMKRADMVRNLSYVFEGFGTFDNPAELAEMAVGFLEGQGMLPPTVKNKKYSGWKSDYSGIPAYINEWEPEDE